MKKERKGSAKIFIHLKWFFKKNWKQYLIVAILLLLLSILSVFPAKFLGAVIDEITESTLNVKSLILFVIGLLGVPVGRYILNIVYHYNINKLGHSLLFELREQYITHLFELDNETYEKYTKGDLIARATNDLNNLSVFATSFLQSIVFNTSLVVSAIFMMVVINPLLTLCSVFIMPIAIFWLNKQRLKKRAYYKTHHEIYANMTENVLESIEGVKTVRAYRQEDNDFKKTKKAIDADVDSWWYILKFESVYGPLFELVYAFCYFVAIGFGAYMVITSKISTGDLVTFLMYVAMLYAPLINLSNMLNNINNINISDDRFYEIMDIVPKVKDVEESKNIVKFNEIKFENVSFKYPFDKFDVIKNITFSIKSGETIGIVGPTGAGKSTLIRQLLREFNVTSGNILIDNTNIIDYKIEDVHNLVGYVPQEHVLFRRTVDDNILIGNPNANNKEIDIAMKIADFKKDLNNLPEGINTMVSELGGSLSGGQRQRLSIARALVKNPEILILDDSLSAVDALTESNIIRELREQRSDKTNIIVAHRFSAIKESDKIIVLQDGKITDIGTHKELLSYDNWYKEQYLKQINNDQLNRGRRHHDA